MKHALFAGAAIGTLLIGPALAADMPATAPVVAPPYGWTGWYAGLNAGYGWGRPTADLTGDPNGGAHVVGGLFGLPSPTASASHSFDASGFVGGGQIGYNWQIARNWVAGLEADIQYSGVQGDTFFATLNGGVEFGLNARQQLRWFGTVRGRLGFLPHDRVLVFATGGLAYGHTKASASIANISSLSLGIVNGSLFCPAFAVCLAGSQLSTSAGWTAGGGLELAAWNKVTLRVEYLHVDLADQTLTLVAQPPASGTGFVTATFDNAFHIIRAAFNMRF